MSGEPPSAGPHARWCGRGRLDTCPYPIALAAVEPSDALVEHDAEAIARDGHCVSAVERFDHPAIPFGFRVDIAKTLAVWRELHRPFSVVLPQPRVAFVRRDREDPLAGDVSLTWNTEILSAFLLVGVGLIWLILSIRLLLAAEIGPI